MLPRPRILSLVLPLAVVLLWAVQATAASSDGAAAHVHDLAAEALVVLGRSDLTVSEREAALRPVLRDGLDLDHIGRFALGRRWNDATAAQRSVYTDLFSEFVIKTTAKRLGGFVGENFEILSVKTVGDDDILVLSQTERQGDTPVVTAWRVRQVGERHRVIDVSVGGLSLARTRRQEFAAVTRKLGIDGLLQVLRARIGRLTVAAN